MRVKEALDGDTSVATARHRIRMVYYLQRLHFILSFEDVISSLRIQTQIQLPLSSGLTTSSLQQLELSTTIASAFYLSLSLHY